MSLSIWIHRKRHTLLILFFGSGLIYAVATLKPVPEPNVQTDPAIIDVAVVAIKPETLRLSVKSQGTVIPRRELDIVTQVAGLVVSSIEQFVSGGTFQANEALISIDPRDYQLALISAEGHVAEAEQILALERGKNRQAKREWRDLGNAEANELSLRKPQLKAAEAQMATAIANRDKAKLDLERTHISVPFAGRIRETMVDIGQYVSPGTKIARVYDSKVALIRLPITGHQAALIDLPMGVEGSHPKVTISGSIAGVQQQWQGTIVRTEATIDTRSRFYYVVAEILQPDQTQESELASANNNAQPMLVGMFVEAEIEGKLINDVISLPKQSVFKRNKIFVLDDNNRVLEKQVDVLQSGTNSIWVKGNLLAGERVVTQKQTVLTAGLKVNPKNVIPTAQLVINHKQQKAGS